MSLYENELAMSQHLPISAKLRTVGVTRTRRQEEGAFRDRQTPWLGWVGAAGHIVGYSLFTAATNTRHRMPSNMPF